MKKLGIIGYPLSHSFSPAYFSENFLKEGLINFTYEAYPLASINELPLLLKSEPELIGLNVTIPYKKSVIDLLNNSSSIVSEIEACNCIAIKEGHLTGYNTDVTGFEKSIKPMLSNKHAHALILGTGGAARAVAYVLKKLGIEYLFVTRNPLSVKQHIIYSALTADVISSHKLIINATPLGMFPNVAECPDIPYHLLTEEHFLYDLIYNPAKTLFLQKGLAKGAAIKNGFEMLQIQAEESWKIWSEP